MKFSALFSPAQIFSPVHLFSPAQNSCAALERVHGSERAGSLAHKFTEKFLREHARFQVARLQTAGDEQKAVGEAGILLKVRKVVKIQIEPDKGIALVALNRNFKDEIAVVVELARIIVQKGIIGDV